MRIATNSDGQFIVADDGDKTIKVFDSNGNFLLSFKTRINDVGEGVTISDVATDENNNIYVLESLKKPGAEDSELEVTAPVNCCFSSLQGVIVGTVQEWQLPRTKC